jgi:hypothetical protein
MSTTRTLNVAGGNLFAIAAAQLGDATQWYTIAQLRIAAFQPAPLPVAEQLALFDPWLQGTVTLTIPAPLAFGGGTDGVLGA